MSGRGEGNAYQACALNVILYPGLVKVAFERYEENRGYRPCRDDGKHGSPDFIEPAALDPFQQQDGAGSAEIERRDVEDVDCVQNLARRLVWLPVKRRDTADLLQPNQAVWRY